MQKPPFSSSYLRRILKFLQKIKDGARIVFDYWMASGRGPLCRRRFLPTSYLGSRQGIDKFHEAGIVRITNGGLATWLHPFGMLEPQVVVNLLPKLGIGADLVRHNYLKVLLVLLGFSPMRSHSGRSLSYCVKSGARLRRKMRKCVSPSGQRDRDAGARGRFQKVVKSQ
jgi:hypothetical protein